MFVVIRYTKYKVYILYIWIYEQIIIISKYNFKEK